MGKTTAIQWTDATVNFWWGCTKVGLGCDHCYAEALDGRFGGGHWGLDAPRRKIKSAAALIHKLDNDYAWWGAEYGAGLLLETCGPRRRVFIQSMSDLFDMEVPVEWFSEAWRHIESCDRLELQLVTKRISAVRKRLDAIGKTMWPRHAGLIITVVNQVEADRDIPRLLELKADLGIPWVGLSCEPLLGPIDPPLIYDIDWVIAGGESGPRARPSHPDWFRSLRDQCAAAGVPFHFKQWGEWAYEGQSTFMPGPAFFDKDGSPIDPCPVDPGPPEIGTHWTWWEDLSFPSIRLGKARAGRLLDGVEHNGFPQVRDV